MKSPPASTTTITTTTTTTTSATPTHPTSSRSRTRSPSRMIKESFNDLVHRVREVISPPPSELSTNPSRRGRSPDRKNGFTASTGRGGAGNMVSSKSRDRAALNDQQEQQATDRVMKKMPDLPRSHGRGGAGNIRSPSRDIKKRAEEQTQIRKLEQEEKEIEALYDDQHKLDPVHVGRGGAGNMIH
ncbi:hypothetical protein PCANC_09480 [Puccinia coronata f. sp. avenae]|uniref:Uncharacterized protein n=1 Tax=Puccinia coronata f. sp. avenae TaxID=200324 RepID=A0A2N5VVN1_9BASI|nr:hypothetical protein PCASD_08924 [Puccinia coronata f. sp. avenae]PLW54012.1 hypothetical protein PCANC_09480 [Puccinia coronata f. sp. avenae]